MKGKTRLMWTMAVILILAIGVPGVLAQDTGQGVIWEADYWANRTLTGDPMLQRTESAVIHDWGTGSPDPRVPPDRFSARWTTNVNLAGGTYRFSSTSDDGMRVWVDGELIINEWYDHPALTVSTEIAVAAGRHSLRVEYYENGGEAVARLEWQRISIARDEWQGQYFNSITPTGQPALVRVDDRIDFDWGDGSPAPNLIAADRFSVRWTRFAYLDGGTYRFVVTSDDGVRVWVDNELIIDEWTVHSARSFKVDVPLDAGQHRLRVEYFENTGQALVSLSLTRLAAVIPRWRAEYYNNMVLQGRPDLVRVEESIDLEVGDGSPAPGIISADNFSVRWQTTVDLEPGSYRFAMTVDDGGRLWIGNQLLIDAWQDQAATTYTEEIFLSGGPFTLQMEYYEHTGLAMAVLSWTQLDAPSQRGALVIDNTAAGFIRGGSPEDWQLQRSGFRGTSLWTWNSASARLNYNWARWTPNLSAGTYEVQVFIPRNSATTTNARYQVAHANEFTPRMVNQLGNQGTWVSLGTYFFKGSVEEYVSLSDVTFEPHMSTMVAYDAVQWILQR